MSDEIKQAVEAVNKAFGEFKETNDARLKAIEGKGTSDPLIDAKMAKLEAALDAADKKAEEAVLAIKRSQRVVTDEKGNVVDLDAKAQEWADITATSYDQRPFDMTAKSMTEYKAAQAVYVRKGMDALSIDERKALSVGGDATGGFVVYPDMSGQIVTKVDETSPMRAYASVQVISTDALEGLIRLGTRRGCMGNRNRGAPRNHHAEFGQVAHSCPRALCNASGNAEDPGRCRDQYGKLACWQGFCRICVGRKPCLCVGQRRIAPARVPDLRNRHDLAGHD